MATPPAGLHASLLGIGNPLLDISAVVTQEFLDKYEVRRCLDRRRMRESTRLLAAI